MVLANLTVGFKHSVGKTGIENVVAIQVVYVYTICIFFKIISRKPDF